MLQLIRTDAHNEDFVQLVRLLDAYLREIDGDEHTFFAQFNKTDTIQHVVVAYQNATPVGCGALKAFDSDTAEIKRMYVNPLYRGQKIATNILTDLELWAKQLGYHRCILETGIRQAEAIQLYKKCAYQVIANYGQYANVESSVCFEKILELR